jgi:Protein of unknown function (DUF3017)
VTTSADNPGVRRTDDQPPDPPGDEPQADQPSDSGRQPAEATDSSGGPEPAEGEPGPHDSPPDPLAGYDPLPPIRGGWVGRQWPLLLVLVLGAAGLITVAAGHFRGGCQLLGASVLCAAVARTVLPPRRVGLLVVRSRLFDVAVLLVLGISIEVLAAVIPRP